MGGRKEDKTLQEIAVPERLKWVPEAVRGWGDMAGKVFAYSDPLSNSGWLVAQGELAAAGSTLLMLHFLHRLRLASTPDPEASDAAGPQSRSSP